MQLLMGMSIRRYLPASGTAGLLRSFVRGYKRVPRPPPRIRASTFSMAASRTNRDDKTRINRGYAITSAAEGEQRSGEKWRFVGAPSRATGASGEELHQPGGDLLGLLGAVVQGDAVVGVACENQSGVSCGPFLDLPDPVEVPDV